MNGHKFLTDHPSKNLIYYKFICSVPEPHGLTHSVTVFIAFLSHASFLVFNFFSPLFGQ